MILTIFNINDILTYATQNFYQKSWGLTSSFIHCNVRISHCHISFKHTPIQGWCRMSPFSFSCSKFRNQVLKKARNSTISPLSALISIVHKALMWPEWYLGSGGTYLAVYSDIRFNLIRGEGTCCRGGNIPGYWLKIRCIY